MNDPFAQHGITHLSPSSINQFIMNPCKWVMSVAGYKDPFGNPAMWRGTAVDMAVDRAVLNPQEPQRLITEYAKEQFLEMRFRAEDGGYFPSDRKLDQEKTNLESFTDTAVAYYRNLETPEDTQTKISVELDFLPVPIIGYADLVYKDSVRELKTISRKLTYVPDSHSRQLSVYALALQKTPFVDYVYVTVSGKQEVRPMAVTNTEHHFEIVKKTARNMMKLLSVSESIEEVASLLMPDLDHWSFSLAREKEFARELWGIER